MKTALTAVSRFVDRRQPFFFPAPAVAILFLIVLVFNVVMNRLRHETPAL